jgi:osmotically inducible protein OsmC
MIDRKAEARWEGSLREGKGRIRLGSGAFEGPYAFGSRFEAAAGTNPEELLGAAHAGCFTMALSHMLTSAGHPPSSLETTATVHLDKVGEGFSIIGIDLVTKGKVPGADEALFLKLASDAGEKCIVSRALSVPIKVDATFLGA